MQEKDLERICELTDDIFDKIAELKEIYRALGEELQAQFLERVNDKFDGPFEH